MIIGRFDAAQVEFEQGIRYKPDSAEIHYNLGKLFSIQDNWEPARKAFEAAAPARPLLRRGAGRARVRARGARRRRGRGRAATRRRSRSTTSATGPLRLAAREPERLLQPHRRSGQGARIRAQGARARSQVRRRVVSEGQGRRAPGTPRRGGRRAEPGHRAQLPSLLVLLRPGRPLSPAGPGGREPEGARLLQAPRARDERAGEDAAPRLPRQRGRPRRRRDEQPLPRPRRRPVAASCRCWGARRRRPSCRGSDAPAPLAGRARARVSSRTSPPRPACRTPGTSPAARRTSSSCSRRWAAASRFFDYDNDGWLDIFLVNGTQPRPEGPGRQPHQLPLPQQPRRHVHRRHREGRPDPFRLGPGLLRRRLRQRRLRRPLRHLLGTERPLPQQRRRHVHRRLREGRGRGIGRPLGRRLLLPRLRPRRPPRSVRRELRELRSGDGARGRATRPTAATTRFRCPAGR